MPTFEFDNDLEPVTVMIGGERFDALPAIPADDFPKFMGIFAKIPPLLEDLKDADKSDGTDKSDGERTARRLAAFAEFIRVSIEGLQLVMTKAAIEQIQERAASGSANPISAQTLASVFSRLAGFYMSGGKEGEDEEDARPTGDDNASSPLSSTTGGSSEANSSSGDADSDSGPITT